MAVAGNIARVPGRGRPSGRDAEIASRRRNDILTAAIAVIADHGLSGVTMELVADAAGVSPGTVTFHFVKKEQLLLSVLDTVVGEFEQARHAAIARADGDCEAALDGIIDVTFDADTSSVERVAVWYAFWGEAKARNIYLNRVGHHDQAYQADLVRLFSQLAKAGGYRNLNAEVMAGGFAGYLEWLWQGAITDGDRFDRAAARLRARAYLNGVFERHFR